jgi:hypothetical protein
MFAVPQSVGQRVLGDVWNPTFALILPVTLEVVVGGLVAGAATGLRALGAAGRSLNTQLCSSAWYLTGGLAGAAAGGVLGSAWGVAIAGLLGSVVWWWQFRLGMRRHVDPVLTASPQPTNALPPG